MSFHVGRGMASGKSSLILWTGSTGSGRAPKLSIGCDVNFVKATAFAITFHSGDAI